MLRHRYLVIVGLVVLGGLNRAAGTDSVRSSTSLWRATRYPPNRWLLDHFVVRIISSCLVAGRGWPARPAACGRAWPRRSGGVRRYALRASSSRMGRAMPSSCTCPSSTKLTPSGGARSATRSLTRTRLALA
jgi:hypothetical protein